MDLKTSAKKGAFGLIILSSNFIKLRVYLIMILKNVYDIFNT